MKILNVEGSGLVRGVGIKSKHGCFSKQTWTSEPRPVKGYSPGSVMQVAIRFDDECGNGHNSFAITACVGTPRQIQTGDWQAGGCMHDEIAQVFPELAPLVKWHLFDTNGPMYYLQNTTYHASDKDCHGLSKGERRQIRKGGVTPCWMLVTVDAEGNEIDVPKSIDADERPEQSYRMEYRPWCRVGEGKERQLEYARSSACWPEATDEQLCLPKAELEALLLARLPALLAAFRTDMEAIGFLWSPEAPKEAP